MSVAASSPSSPSGQPPAGAHASGRLPSLDGLRGVAALMVVFAHSQATEGWPDWRLLEELRKTASGFLGVQIFFVISGFIITRLLLTEKTAIGQISLKRFWGRRFLRIMPPLAVYLGCLSLLKHMGVIHLTTLSQLGSLFFFRNHLPQTDSFNAHCWSLSVEEQFYLAWPFCVAMVSSQTLRKIAWAVIVVAFLSRSVANAMGSTEWRWLIYHADCLMAGALGAFWLQMHGPAAVKPLSTRSMVGHFLAFVAILMLSRASATSLSRLFAPIQPTAVTLFGACWIVRLVSVRQGIVFRFLNLRLMVWLGVISYSVYLWQQLVSSTATHWLNGAPWFAHFPMNVVMSIVAGALSYYLLERPLQALRHRWDAWLGVKAPPRASTTLHS